ncbi:EAL domain-containing protein [Actinoplanes siamensis]|uniref:EAL domain-containing protein n=1 Tax=Actinoplanes siamensis TaxID=1223317 RepID=A0A919N0E2_9ACTN|nr:EAL domain-containing protein [Actinoplanes siamensis]GIF02714.1 hypothetical protein Asi03nite_02520 [Actinoplanes siamensis]
MATRTADSPTEMRAESDAAVDLVLRDRLVTPLFQPIVDLANGAVVAVEGLARGPAGSGLERPDQLFEAARLAGRLGEMDMLCSERAIECALAATVPPPVLFVNAEPAVLDQPMSPRMLELSTGYLPFRFILEYTERGLPTVPGALLNVAGAIEACGGGIALDDVGADPMSLAFLPIIEPEVIKLDMHLVHNPSAAATRETCRAVRAAARRTGAVVIAEGIETEADLRTARSLGADWGQGWLFGRPGPLECLRYPVPAGPGVTLRPPRVGLHQPAGTPFEIAAARGARQVVLRDSAIQAVTRLCESAGSEGPSVIVASCDDPGAATRLAAFLDTVSSPTTYVAVVPPTRPLHGAMTVAVVGADSADGVSVRPLAGGDGNSDHFEIAASSDLSVVVDIARVLLRRLPMSCGTVSFSAARPAGAR